MATSLPSPPESRSSTPASEQQVHLKRDPSTDPDADTLSQRLDELLEQYLHLLDQYTLLREELSKSFSSGFFSLAHAQRASTLGAGRRYGQEYYDERMKAQRMVKVDEEYQPDGLVWKVGRKVAPATTAGDAGSRAKEEDAAAVQPSEKHEQVEENNKKEWPKQDPATRDPITWFGILAPSSLRQCQSHFTSAVENQIPDLLSVESDMRQVEDQIWALREKLGLVHEYDRSHADEEETEDHELGGAETQVKVPAKVSTAKASTSTKNLPSRPAHVKSHLLKLGE